MKTLMNIHYDEEGDFLEITLGKPKESYVEDIGEGIYERIDEKTGKIIGIGVLSFKKRSKNAKEISFNLPISMALEQANQML